MNTNKLRPLFHFSCPKGWMNDPNGFSFFNGQFHLFFQHNPSDTKWGPMHWGHAVSKDLLHFKNLPIALFPDSDFDKEGCFSGTCITENDKQILIYTGVTKSNSENIQEQCIAFGDGKTYTKSEKNPVIKSSDIPFDFCKTDFRDPKIFKDNDKYFCAAVIKKTDNNGAVVLFSSDDLISWKYENLIAETKGDLGGMWECPDLFSLDDHDVLILSPQQVKEDKIKGFKNGNNCVYISGTFDKDKKLFNSNASQSDINACPLDYGLDFYAAQTMQTPDNRRILIAWMQSWDNNIYPENFKWCGQMTLPRELFFKNNILYQHPVKEYENMVSKLPYLSGVINKNMFGIFDKKNYSACDLTLNFIPDPDKIKTEKDEQIKVTVSDDKEQSVSFTFDTKTMSLTFDRSNSIKYGGNPNIHSVSLASTQPSETEKPAKVKSKITSLRFIFDLYSCEVFINGGEKVFTNTYFLNKKVRKIRIDSTLFNGLQFKIVKL